MARMSPAQWESLCDGCGRCCVNKLEDEETGEVFMTNVACRLLDGHAARCADYAGRKRLVPECVRLTPRNIARMDWLPSSCGYRRVAAGDALPAWHPLVSGDPESVHRAGQSTRGWTVSEDNAGELELHIVEDREL